MHGVVSLDVPVERQSGVHVPRLPGIGTHRNGRVGESKFGKLRATGQLLLRGSYKGTRTTREVDHEMMRSKACLSRESGQSPT